MRVPNVTHIGPLNASTTPESVTPQDTEATIELIKLKVGASSVPHGNILKFIKENMVKKAGLDLTDR
jgi:ABC-type metal ion transport system substrate-binding protein